LLGTARFGLVVDAFEGISRRAATEIQPRAVVCPCGCRIVDCGRFCDWCHIGQGGVSSIELGHHDSAAFRDPLDARRVRFFARRFGLPKTSGTV